MLGAWQFSALLGILWGFYQSNGARHAGMAPRSSSPAALLRRSLNTIAQMAQIALWDLEFVLALLLPLIAASDILRRTITGAATKVEMITKLLAFSYSPWLELDPGSLESEQMFIRPSSELSLDILESLVDEIASIQACVSIIEYFLKFCILFFIPALLKLRIRPLSLNTSKEQRFRLGLGVVTLSLCMAAARQLRNLGTTDRPVFKGKIKVEVLLAGFAGSIVITRLDSEVVEPTAFSPEIALQVPCYLALMRWLFSFDYRDRALFPEMNFGMRTILGVFFIAWLLIIMLVSPHRPLPSLFARLPAKTARILQLAFLCACSIPLTILFWNLMILLSGPMLLVTSLLRNGGCIYRAANASVIDLDQLYNLISGLVIPATASAFRLGGLRNAKAQQGHFGDSTSNIELLVRNQAV